MENVRAAMILKIRDALAATSGRNRNAVADCMLRRIDYGAIHNDFPPYPFCHYPSMGLGHIVVHEIAEL